MHQWLLCWKWKMFLFFKTNYPRVLIRLIHDNISASMSIRSWILFLDRLKQWALLQKSMGLSFQYSKSGWWFLIVLDGTSLFGSLSYMTVIVPVQTWVCFCSPIHVWLCSRCPVLASKSTGIVEDVISVDLSALFFGRFECSGLVSFSWINRSFKKIRPIKTLHETQPHKSRIKLCVVTARVTVKW